jgi:6-phospho-3-hexuloisomerase
MKSKLIIGELEELFSSLNSIEYDSFLNSFIEGIEESPVIGIGAGRMGYSLRAFIMRLSHMKLNASMIGDTNVPSICKNTKIIINSSSGETESIVLFAQKAKKHGAKIYLITSNPNSSIGKISDSILSYKIINSLQIMKSVYEQFTLLLFDSLALDLSEKKSIGHDVMQKNHSILE